MTSPNPQQASTLSAEAQRKRMRQIVSRMQHYVATYTDQAEFANYSDETFINDMLYGIGCALCGEYRMADGFSRFKERIAREIVVAQYEGVTEDWAKTLSDVAERLRLRAETARLASDIGCERFVQFTPEIAEHYASIIEFAATRAQQGEPSVEDWRQAIRETCHLVYNDSVWEELVAKVRELAKGRKPA